MAGAGPLEVVEARTIGAVWLLDQLWHRLQVGAAVRVATDARRFTTNMERVLFALVANRAVAPMSKLSAAEWVREDVAIPGLSTMDEDQAYRAMDLLVDADVAGRVQESVFFAIQWDHATMPDVVGAWRRWAPDQSEHLAASLLLNTAADPSAPVVATLVGAAHDLDADATRKLLRAFAADVSFAPARVVDRPTQLGNQLRQPQHRAGHCMPRLAG